MSEPVGSHDHEPVDPGDVDDLLAALPEGGRRILLGLYAGRAGERELLVRHMPAGTRVLLTRWGAISAEGELAPLGLVAARTLRHRAGEGPDPRLVDAADALAARVLPDDPTGGRPRS